MKQIFSLSMLIIGTVIGAGFASGKELCTFFIAFGLHAYWLAALAGVLFFFAFWLILSIADSIGKGGVECMDRELYGRAYGLGVLILVTNNMLMTSSMLGAFDVILPLKAFPIGSVIGAVICIAVLLAGQKGMLRVNAIAVPLIIVLLLTVGIYGMIASDGQLSLGTVSSSYGVVNTILYVGMNVLTLGAAVSGMKTSRKTRIGTAAIASILITVLMVIEIAAIRSFDFKVFQSDMPLLEIAKFIRLDIVARIVMALGVFTTLAVCVHTLSEWLLPLVNKNRFFSLLIILTLGFVVSRFGFGNIVSYLYPILGAIGVVEMIAGCLYQGKALWQAKRVKSTL